MNDQPSNHNSTAVYRQGWSTLQDDIIRYTIPWLNDSVVKKHPILLDKPAMWRIPHEINLHNNDINTFMTKARVKHVNHYSVSDKMTTTHLFQSQKETCINSFQDGCHFIWSSVYFTQVNDELIPINLNDFVSDYDNIIVKFKIRWLSWPCVNDGCRCRIC